MKVLVYALLFVYLPFSDNNEFPVSSNRVSDKGGNDTSTIILKSAIFLPGDSVSISFYPPYYSSKYPEPEYMRVAGVVDNNDEVKLRFGATIPNSYMTINRGRRKNGSELPIIRGIFIPKPVSIRITIDTLYETTFGWDPHGISIEGQGANLIRCQFAIAGIEDKWKRHIGNVVDIGLKLKKDFPDPKQEGLWHFTASLEGMLRKQTESLELLKSYKSKIDGSTYEVIRANIIGDFYKEANSEFFNLYGLESIEERSIKEEFRKSFLSRGIEKVSDFAVSTSKSFVDGSIMYMKNKYITAGDKKNVLVADEIFSNFSGKSQERMLYTFLRSTQKFDADFYNYLKKIQQTVKEPHYQELVDKVVRLNTQDEKVAPFVLTDKNDKRVSLEKYKGKVVFLDFWYTGCTNCASYYREVVSQVEEKYRSRQDIVFMTISTDRDKQSWQKSLKEGRYTSSHSINLYTDGMGRNHPIIDDYVVNRYPRPILIGKDGNIISSNSAELRKKERLLELIEDAIDN